MRDRRHFRSAVSERRGEDGEIALIQVALVETGDHMISILVREMRAQPHDVEEKGSVCPLDGSLPELPLQFFQIFRHQAHT